MSFLCAYGIWACWKGLFLIQGQCPACLAPAACLSMLWLLALQLQWSQFALASTCKKLCKPMEGCKLPLCKTQLRLWENFLRAHRSTTIKPTSLQVQYQILYILMLGNLGTYLNRSKMSQSQYSSYSFQSSFYVRILMTENPVFPGP